MTTSRRLPLIAVCLASASLLATQPALAGSPSAWEEKAREQPAPPADPMTTLTELLKRITQILKNLQDQSAERTTTIQRG